ncbi:hypothetical protein P0Y35_03780 [Kiritimatiellaeota bacterium B1221]|nr:hypothetical protein [Kiritimatiellaeota bacterium B1221]
MDELCFLETSLQFEQEYAKPYFEVDWDALKKQIEEIPNPFFLSREAFWNNSRTQAKLISGPLMLQQARIAVELYRIRLETGAFPENLEATGMENLQDPFTGEDLKYEKTDEGFRLYSVGGNQVDEHGNKNRKTNEDDILWNHPYVEQ